MVVISTFAFPWDKKLKTESDSKSKKSGQNTALFFNVPKAAIYNSGILPVCVKTNSPFFTPNTPKILANNITSEAQYIAYYGLLGKPLKNFIKNITDISKIQLPYDTQELLFGYEKIQTNDNNVNLETNVLTINIEKLFDLFNIKHIDYLKLDCEGGEQDIFKTIQVSTLKNIKKIALEFHSVEIKNQITDKLTQNGFEITKQFFLHSSNSVGVIFAINKKLLKKMKPILILDAFITN